MNTLDIGWCYHILELDRSAPCREVKRAYLDLLIIWDPGRFCCDARLQKKCRQRIKDLETAFLLLEPLLNLGIAAELHPEPLPSVMKPVCVDGRWGYATEFSQGLAVVRLADKFGYIDQSGIFIVPPEFEAAESFREGFAVVRLHGKCGLIRTDGSWLAGPQFNDMLGFENGRGYGRIGRRWVVVDGAGVIHDYW